jgi:hypothetical protein
MEIDWSKFDGDHERYVWCTCGTVFRSHVTAVRVREKLGHFTEKPCPGCGRTDGMTKSSDSAWEYEKLEPREQGDLGDILGSSPEPTPH